MTIKLLNMKFYNRTKELKLLNPTLEQSKEN